MATVATLEAIVDTMAEEVGHRYRDLKKRYPDSKISFSDVLLEVVKAHGFVDGEISMMRSLVSKRRAKYKKAKVRR